MGVVANASADHVATSTDERVGGRSAASIQNVGSPDRAGRIPIGSYDSYRQEADPNRARGTTARVSPPRR